MNTRNQGLELIDTLAAEGQSVVTSNEVRQRLDLSPQAASNVLARLVRDGFAERIRRGEYILHSLGELGVSAVAGDRLGEAIVIAVGDRRHRICFRTALHEHGLLTRSGRIIQVAVDRRLRVSSLGGRPLESVIEGGERIALGTEPIGPAQISTVERALLESAEVPRRVGGIASVAEALAGAELHASSIERLATKLDMHIGLRRLASLDHALQTRKLRDLELPERTGRPLPLDPTDPRQGGWLDANLGVLWPGEPAELVEVIGQ